MIAERNEKGLHIIRFEAENIKRLKAVTIHPDGNTVVISGRNGAGKTSVLDAVMMALAGPKAMDAIPKPIREGETEAFVELDLGEFVVRRIWKTHGAGSVTITAPDGSRFGKQQTFLDERLGKLMFDPLKFAGMSDKEQREALLKIVDLPFDPAEMARQRATFFEDRTIANREVKSLEAQLLALPEPSIDVPADPVNVTELAEEISAAEQQEYRRREMQNVLLAAQERVTRLAVELEAATEQRDTIQAEIEAQPSTGPDVDALRERLASAEAINEQVREEKARGVLVESLATRQGEAEKLSTQIATLDIQKEEAIAAADMPVDGLSFDDEGITYNGVPFKQASGAEQLRVSLGIAMADNPAIRIIRITDGSLLDEDSMAIVEEMVEDRDWQLWIERVGNHPGSIVIDDGEVIDG